MIHIEKTCFHLQTDNTSYIFKVNENNHLVHLYYGKKIKIQTTQGLEEQKEFPHGNAIVYNNTCYEDEKLEISMNGIGDQREPFIEIINTDGSTSNDFQFDSYQMDSNDTHRLPHSYGECDHLKIYLKDRANSLTLILHYYVYAYDVITRNAVLINHNNDDILVNKLMSSQLDLDDHEYNMTTFNGSWANEMNKNSTKITCGSFINASFTGTSSSRSNPFVMVHKEDTSEDKGSCFGFNLVYSGNHYESMEVSAFHKTRITTGMNPRGFSYNLHKDEVLESPETILSYSENGFNGLSHNFHTFINQHIIRGTYQYKQRPILLNSWEACYFKINESKLLNLARKAKEAGIELFVVDDGWFGQRNDDTSSLGDWYVNKDKLPHGLDGLCKKINAMGLDFGLWVEPEMINVNSNLYKEHPDWVLDIPNKDHHEGRNQRILDLCNPDVVEYIIETMKNVLSSCNITYIKWDMNRIFSDYHSRTLSNQGEVQYKYYLGLYKIMHTLTTSFPHILFEGCASGGNRFDLGILSYFPQIWASDNTDAGCRVKIQNNLSYGYPLSCMSNHVSGIPNHQTLRTSSLQTRYNIACFGILGYECNLCDLSKDEFEQIKEQVALYKENREIYQYGTFYRSRSNNIYEWTITSNTKAIGMYYKELFEPNNPNDIYYPKGLDEDAIYHLYNTKNVYNIKEFGDLINTQSPIHIKQNSMMHNTISKFMKMDGEVEDITNYGSCLMQGVHLKPAFVGTGYNENTRLFKDFTSRMYYIEKKQADN